MNSNNLTIYLADDHEIVAQAIVSLLLALNGIKDVKSFTNGKDLFEECKKTIPDLVILDLEMLEWSGLTTLKKIKEQYLFPVIMLSMNDEKTLIENSIKEGAKGYLHKNCSVSELQLAIDTVLRGDLFLSEETKKILVGLKLPTNNTNYTPIETLTDKEYEVLKLVCEGLTSKEIGEKLFLSSRTVETRKNNLMQKFNVQTTGKLISLAIKNKIVN